MLFRKGAAKIGLPPGALIHVGESRDESTRITVFDFTPDSVDEQVLGDVGDVAAYRDHDSVTWINIDGLGDVSLVDTLGKAFGLHPLVLEDILNTSQRPKVEEYEDYLYIVVKMLDIASGKDIRAEQVSIILGDGFVLSFQEWQGDVFDPVRERIRTGGGRVRRMGADYLAYLLLDAVTDGYFGLIESLDERVQELDDLVIDDPSPETARLIQKVRTEMVHVRRAVRPLRETVSGLQRSETLLITGELRPYLADLYDHTIQVTDSADALRDIVIGLRDTYLSSLSHHMNEVMKVLTIIATIFIPITFIAGIYGMNFHNMPELDWKYGYFSALGVMAGVAGGMLLYFRRKLWI